MLTLTYGVKKPESGDRGSVFWPAMEDNFQQLNDHTHNGTDSAKLTSASVTDVVQTIAAASWVAQGGGTYKQTVTMPGGMAYDDFGIVFKLSTGDIIYPSVAKVGASSYDVWINDNTLTLKAVYV